MFRKSVVLSPALVLISAITILLTGCSAPLAGGSTQSAVEPTQSPPPGASPAANTAFGKMLAMVPYSFLTDLDIWFGDPAKSAAIQGFEGIHSYADLKNLPAEKRDAFTAAYSQIAVVQKWRNLDSAPLLGFDSWMFDRSVFTETPPPWSFSIDQGNFDSALIKTRLVEQGYSKVDYGKSSYYSIRGDYEPADFKTNLGKMGIMASLNRVAVLDNTIATSTTTAGMTGILDAVAGKGSIADNAAGKALADSLGEVLSGVLMNPQRVLNVNPPQANPPFDFTVPADWGILHQYDMVGMGYKNDDKGDSWIISLYYKDAAAASADAAILPVRLKSYIFNTQILNPQLPPDRQGVGKRIPLTDRYSVGEPVVQRFSAGATLTVECRGDAWPFTLILDLRDLLFLAPDPTPYLAASQPPTSQPPANPNASQPPPDLTKNVFTNFTNISVGAQEGYNDLSHQKITAQIQIANQSATTVKNVRVTVSTLATNDSQKPQLLEAQPQTAGHLDFAPGESETYDISWNYDGSGGSKADTSNLVSQTVGVVNFIDQTGGQQTEKLFPLSPYPTLTP